MIDRTRAAFALPGDIATLTGGYVYDRRLVEGLRAAGRAVEVISLPASLPRPPARDMARAIAQLQAVPGDVPLIVDGLAFGALDPAGVAGIRAPLVAMIHHPLAQESALPADLADHLWRTERANLAHARHVLVPSPHTRDMLVARYDVPAARITVARPGTDRPRRAGTGAAGPERDREGSDAARERNAAAREGSGKARTGNPGTREGSEQDWEGSDAARERTPGAREGSDKARTGTPGTREGSERDREGSDAARERTPGAREEARRQEGDAGAQMGTAGAQMGAAGARAGFERTREGSARSQEGPDHSQDVPPLILSVGLLHPRKGHDVLIAALTLLADLDWRAVIAGTPWDEAHARALRDQIAGAGLGARLTLAGRVDDDRLAGLYAGAAIFALATRYEGYGIVFDEALSHGLPIVSTRAGAVPDTVPPEAGLLVPPDDAPAFARALARLLRDPAERASRARAAARAGAALPGWSDTAAIAARVLDALA